MKALGSFDEEVAEPHNAASRKLLGHTRLWRDTKLRPMFVLWNPFQRIHVCNVYNA